MLNIILTSYNRPRFLQRTLESLLAQTDERWRCVVKDDGSDGETLDVLAEYGSMGETRLSIILEGEPEDRQANARYAVLINQELPHLTTGIVGYLCDNVEYAPDLVGIVLAWFDEHPMLYAGYVTQARDAWTSDGARRLGPASALGHWDLLPPGPGVPIVNAMGVLDHSQVFHRLPTALRWEESRAAVSQGDGIFYNRLIAEHGPIYPIAAGTVLTTEHLVK